MIGISIENSMPKWRYRNYSTMLRHWHSLGGDRCQSHAEHGTQGLKETVVLGG